MELLKSAHRKSRLSEVLYITLNIAFAIAVYVAIVVINSPPLAFALVILSKWRMFAVRPRFWAANILTNLVDMIVGLSVVTLLWNAHDMGVIQIALTGMYIAWLLLIKPRSKRHYIAIQSGVAIFLGVTALATVGHIITISGAVNSAASNEYMRGLDMVIYIVGMWIIGYSAAKHYIGSYDHEPLINIYSLVWGLIFAEFGWLMYHWTFAYTIPGFGATKLVQGAIILTLMSFVAERVYVISKKQDEIRLGDVIAPIIFSVSIIILLVVFFNSIPAIGG